MKSLIILLMALAGTLPLASQTTFYVSPQGKDSNPGSREAPFGSPARALDAARQLQNETDVRICLRGGEYRLAAPLRLTPADGNRQRRLTLYACPGEQPVIKGSIRLTPRWKPYRGKIMQTRLDHIAPPDMLLVDGSLRPMARYPNYDPQGGRFNGTAADATAPDRVKGWKNPAGGYLHAMHLNDWGDFHYRITGKDSNNRLTLEGGWQNNRPDGISRDYRMVENIFEELDAPGEWYYDSAASILYYYPLPGEDIRQATFEVPQLKHLVELTGNDEQPVMNITLQELELTQTVRTFMEEYEPLLRSDWTIYRGGAILLEGTEDCHITDCTLHNLGGNAIFFSRYNRRSGVSGSHLHHIGASAVCFAGDPQAVRSPSFGYGQSVPPEQLDSVAGPLNVRYPARCLVADNLIHDIGLYEKQSTGVELSMCQYITVSHNSIYRTPRAGINVSEGTWGGHIIEYNDVFHTVRETGDHGSFNSWGRDRFWTADRDAMNRLTAGRPDLILADAQATIVIRNNRFRCDHGWDIDLDDGSSNYHIYNNLCLNGGIKLREGFYRVVENNILVNNTFHPHVWFGQSGDVFTRNIVMTPYQPIQIEQWGTLVDYNIFTDSLSYRAARQEHTDLHSIVCPQPFAAPERGDYHVDNRATAVFRTGFQNFDMESFGVQSPRLRAISLTPPLPLPVTARPEAAPDILTWHGCLVKNLDTPGERSATGMDAERGVYVLGMATPESPLHDYLLPNDVILSLNGQSTDNVDDLLQAEARSGKDKTWQLEIRRNQQQTLLRLPSTVR